MSQTEVKVTAYELGVVIGRVHPVDELIGWSDKHRLGAYYIGPNVDAEEGFDWYPMRIFPKQIHKEAYRRLELLKNELPHLEYEVIIGDEIDENPGPSWEERSQEALEKIAAGGKEALPTVAKIAVAGLAVGVICAAGLAVVSAAAATAPVVTAVAAPVAAPAVGSASLPIVAAVGLLALDPKMVLIVSDGYQNHAVCICSWLD